MKNVFLLLIIVITITSCQFVSILREVKRTHVKSYSYKFEDREIIFVPMHHLGWPEFYDDVHRVVNEKKSLGYRVYYEGVSKEFTQDSILTDIVLRKTRKITGPLLDYTNMKRIGFLKKYTQQPAYSELGISSDDLRADVNFLQLVNEWERIYGEITLDSIELIIPLKSMMFEKTSTRKQFNNIVFKYRNDYLISLIRSNEDKKILILYGAMHRKGFKKKIKG